jgi:precorrin-3B synthase
VVARVVNHDRCPGIVHAVRALDGTLVRVRVPGGLIEPEQLAAIARAAELYADGYVDLTARAGIQLRGVRDGALEALAEALAASGLLPSAAHDRVRNILASPFAGIDPAESIDVRPLVRALDAALRADATLAALPPKFVFAIDGGGFTSPGRADVALSAVETAEGLRWSLAIGGVFTGWGARPESAVAILLDAARAALAFATASHRPEHGWRLASLPGATAAILDDLGTRIVACAQATYRRVPTIAPVGAVPAHRADLVNVVPSIPLGRLGASEAAALAELAERCGADLRLAPWRGVVLGAVRRDALPEVEAELTRLRLPLDGSDGFAGIAACAGSDACPAALADVRADAVRLARRLAGAAAAPGWSVNLAGCSKRCAMRGGASVDLIATDSGYDVHLAGTPLRTSVAAQDALAVAVDAQRSSCDEVQG